MEWNEIQHIRKNLKELLDVTICNTSLIAICAASDILTEEETHRLEIQVIIFMLIHKQIV